MGKRRSVRYAVGMNLPDTNRVPLRRVRAGEAVGHICVVAAGFTVMAQAIDRESVFAVPAALGVLWGGCYLALRVAQVRDDFGEWDGVSFFFVVSFAVLLAGLAVWLLR
jgi:hypothetical protein